MDRRKDKIREKVAEFERELGWYQNIDLGGSVYTKTRSMWGEDADHPRRRWAGGGRCCAEVRGDEVDFRQMSVYELEKLGKRFDLVFFVGILYHCKYLSEAIEQVAKVASKRIIVESAIHPEYSDIPLVRFIRYSNYKGPQGKGASSLPGHWHPNMTALKDFFYEQGFSNIETLFKKGGRGGVL